MKPAIHNFDRTVGIVLIVLISILFWRTFGFQTRPYVPLNTAFWPRMILAGLGLVSVVLILRGRLTDETADVFSWSALIVIAAASIFVSVVSIAGFLGASMLISTAGFIWLSENRDTRDWIAAAAYGLVVSGGIYVLFRMVLKVQLPMGSLG